MFDGIGAELIWDGTDEIKIPERMGSPLEGQMAGTTGEKLTELSGRICYDSLGSKRSRPSAEYIAHILDVGHTSIAEHYHKTIVLEGHRETLIDMLSFVLLNRPWLWAAPESPTRIRLTLNLRVAMEFDRWTKILSGMMPSYPISEATHVGTIIKSCFSPLAPRMIKEPHPAALAVAKDQLGLANAEVVEPQTDAEKWITLYTYGSRGFSHELVRHGDFTGMSQRSTRYCNEGKSPWTLHPLMQMFVQEAPEIEAMVAREETNAFIQQARELYKGWVKRLIPFVKGKIDPDDPYATTTARKQARGAARGLLGNALETELVFSASVMQWRHIFRMRAAGAADGEIRYAACKALEACKASRYGESFSDLELVEAGDGTGHMLAGGGAS